MVVVSFVVVFLIFFMPFGISQGFQNWSGSAASQLSGASVADANLLSVYALPSEKSIPSTSTGTSASFFFPSNVSQAIAVTNLTVGTALQNDVSNISVIISANVQETLTVYLAIGSSNKAYTELYFTTVKIVNTSKSVLAYFPGQAYWYSFPSSDHFMLVVTGAVYGSELTTMVTLKGVSGFEAVFFNPQVWITITLLVLGIIAFAGTYFASPWVEVHTENITKVIKTRKAKHIGGARK